MSELNRYVSIGVRCVTYIPLPVMLLYEKEIMIFSCIMLWAMNLIYNPEFYFVKQRNMSVGKTISSKVLGV